MRAVRTKGGKNGGLRYTPETKGASLNVVQRESRVSFGAFLSTKLKRNTLPALPPAALLTPRGDTRRGDRNEETTARPSVEKKGRKIQMMPIRAIRERRRSF